jgi:transposase
MKCPRCEATERQVKSGFNESGSQRYKCQLCSKRYTPQPVKQGYPEEVRQLAVRMYVDGNNLRRIGRHLGISHQCVANWVKDHARRLPQAPQPEKVNIVEMDELHTFVEKKKTRLSS